MLAISFIPPGRWNRDQGEDGNEGESREAEASLMDTQKMHQPESRRDEARQPYARPSVAWEEDFQPYVFSTCGKMAGQGGPCLFNKKS
jgi:hypothetical protein